MTVLLYGDCDLHEPPTLYLIGLVVVLVNVTVHQKTLVSEVEELVPFKFQLPAISPAAQAAHALPTGAETAKAAKKPITHFFISSPN
jgi:hypothetical protein